MRGFSSPAGARAPCRGVLGGDERARDDAQIDAGGGRGRARRRAAASAPRPRGARRPAAAAAERAAGGPPRARASSGRSGWPARPTWWACSGRRRAPGVELRFRGQGGRWTPWVSAGSHGHGPDRPAPRDGVVGEPLWTGGTRELQLRAARALSGVRVHLIDVSGGVGGAQAGRAVPSRSRPRCRWPLRSSPPAPGSRRSSPGGVGGQGARRGWHRDTARCAWRSSTTPRTPTATGRGRCRRCCARSTRSTASCMAGTTSATTSWSTSTGASSRPARAGSTSRSWALRPVATTSSRPAWRCSDRS